MSSPNSITSITSLASFEAFTKANPSALCVLYFYTDWHQPSKQMLAVLAAAADEFPAVKFAQLEAEKTSEVTGQFPLKSVPSAVFLREGKLLHVFEGADPPAFLAAIRKHSQKTTKKQQQLPVVKPKKDLAALVRSAPVMLFMKGEPSAPRCGFSRQIIELLTERNVVFGYFDILTDNDVRQGLKAFSNWPTYPQVYVNGEFVGGLDIIKELIAEEEFEETFAVAIEEKQDLGKLVARSPVMLFMKGSPAEPRCGFSRTIVGLLQKEGIEFDSFDILSDNEVRQGLKAFSNWPTYPQLYIKGELVGGLDVVSELIEEGELKEML